MHVNTNYLNSWDMGRSRNREKTALSSPLSSLRFSFLCASAIGQAMAIIPPFLGPAPLYLLPVSEVSVNQPIEANQPSLALLPF